MTSQIVLINQSGVAVASDTMLTSGGVKAVPLSRKIYDLGHPHKVVVLHSGASGIGGLDWELLVREWSLEKRSPLPGLSDYAQQFQDWVGKYRDLIPDEADVIQTLICHAMTEYSRRLPIEIKTALHERSKEEKLPADLEQVLVDQLDSTARAWSEGDEYKDISPESVKQLLARISFDIFDDFRAHLCNELEQEISWELGEKIRDAIQNFTFQRLSHWSADWQPQNAMLNFVGFGENEPVGGVVELDIQGIYMGRLRAGISDRHPHVGAFYPIVYYIAQQEAMADFIRGLDGHRRHVLLESLGRTFDSVAKDLAVPDQLKERFLTEFRKKLDKSLWEEFELPFTRTLAGMALPVLLRFADAMVNIQGMRSTTQDEGPGSVGGTIESLTIDRVSGVVWVRRWGSNDGDNVPLGSPLG